MWFVSSMLLLLYCCLRLQDLRYNDMRQLYPRLSPISHSAQHFFQLETLISILHTVCERLNTGM